MQQNKKKYLCGKIYMEYIQFYISDIYLAVSPSHHELISEK